MINQEFETPDDLIEYNHRRLQRQLIREHKEELYFIKRHEFGYKHNQQDRENKDGKEV